MADEDADTRFECQRSGCNKTFAHKSTRSNHQKKCQNGKLPGPVKFTCTNVFCRKKNKEFTSSFNLNRHLKTCKPKVKSQFICLEPYCGRIFDKACQLARHAATHNKPTYTCERCCTEYMRIDKFRIHQKRCAESHSVDPTLPSMTINVIGDGQASCSAAPAAIDSVDPTLTCPLMAINVIGDGHSSCSAAPVEIYSVDPTWPPTAIRDHGVHFVSEVDSSFSTQNDDILYEDDEAAYTSLLNHSTTTSVSEQLMSLTLNTACNTSTQPQVFILDEMSDTSFGMLSEQFGAPSSDKIGATASEIFGATSSEPFGATSSEPFGATSSEQLGATSEPSIDFQDEIAHSTISYLKMIKHQSKRSTIKLQEFAKMSTLLFAHKFDNTQFMEMLADELGFESKESFLKFINLDRIEVNKKRRGRPLSEIVSRQTMYDYWKKHSELSNDRRNARHVIKLKPAKRDAAVVDLIDSQITECETKGGMKLKAQKHIYTLPTRVMFTNFKAEHPDVKCSSTLFYRCKPFYIAPATAREMEGCLCQKCLNPHALYNTLRRYIKDLPLSLSDYLTTFFACQKDKELNFPKIECVTGCCKNTCKIINDSDNEEIDWEKHHHVSYYQFQQVIESYHNKEGEQKFYKRIARVDFHDVPLKQVYDMLMASAEDYLVHRHMTLLDKVYWAKYLCSIDQPVIWMDYSMNVKLTEKNQVQSAHFSGRQQTLHDSLIQEQHGKYTYIYHLSDDTNHDSVMTSRIIEDNIINHPETISSGRLIMRSDNCSTQYKCCYVFKALLDLAKKYGIRIDWLFGEAVHGRGLIDAMAWFGCKGPMHKRILTSDKWFKNVPEMYDFLTDHFKDDAQKEYILIDEKDTAEMRKKGRESRPSPGCRDSHVISFFPDGKSVKMWRTIKDFMNDEEMEMEDVVEEEVEEEVELEWTESIESMDRFELIDVGSFIAIKAEPGHPEFFHLMKVLEKGIATNHISDSSKEHCVLKGEPYLIAKWYSFSNEGRKVATYNKSSNLLENALIHIGEVFSTNIEIVEKINSKTTQYQMDITDYRTLLCSVN